jgi:hypothetical protein
MCAERPSGCRAAEQRDEFTSFKLIEVHSISASQGRFGGYQMGRHQSAYMRTIAAVSR